MHIFYWAHLCFFFSYDVAWKMQASKAERAGNIPSEVQGCYSMKQRKWGSGIIDKGENEDASFN